jgi:hypothetical protein
VAVGAWDAGGGGNELATGAEGEVEAGVDGSSAWLEVEGVIGLGAATGGPVGTGVGAGGEAAVGFGRGVGFGLRLGEETGRGRG